MIWLLAALAGTACVAVVLSAIWLDLRRRRLGLAGGPHPLPDRRVSDEIDHLAPGVFNWTLRDGTFQARRRPEDAW